MPTSTVGRRKANPPPVPEAVAAEYTRRIYALAELQSGTNNIGENVPRVLRLMPDAREMLLNFMENLEPRLAEGADLGHLGDWAGKLAGAVVRIAGLLHLAEHWTEGAQPQDISASTMAAALRIGEYLIPHARAAFDVMDTDPRTAEGRRVTAWLRRERLEHFTERDLYRKFRALSDATRRAALLSDLADRAIIRPEPPPSASPGRNSSPAYTVNPQIHKEI